MIGRKFAIFGGRFIKKNNVKRVWIIKALNRRGFCPNFVHEPPSGMGGSGCISRQADPSGGCKSEKVKILFLTWD